MHPYAQISTQYSEGNEAKLANFQLHPSHTTYIFEPQITSTNSRIVANIYKGESEESDDMRKSNPSRLK